MTDRSNTGTMADIGGGTLGNLKKRLESAGKPAPASAKPETVEASDGLSSAERKKARDRARQARLREDARKARETAATPTTPEIPAVIDTGTRAEDQAPSADDEDHGIRSLGEYPAGPEGFKAALADAVQQALDTVNDEAPAGHDDDGIEDTTDDEEFDGDVVALDDSDEPTRLPPPPRVRGDEREERSHAATLAAVLAYMPQDISTDDRERLANFEERDLARTLGILQQHFGDDPSPAGYLRELNALYISRITDPTNTKAVQGMKSLGKDFLRLASEVSRAIKSDVTINALTASDYQRAAEDAIRDLGVLKKLVSDLEPSLLYCTSFGKIIEGAGTELAMPESMGRLMHILKHTHAHLSTAVSASKSFDQIKGDQRRIIEARDRALTEARAETALALRKASESTLPTATADTAVYIYSGERRAYLGTTQAHPTRIALPTLVWVDKADAALRFTSRAAALGTLDNIMDKMIRLYPNRDLLIAGQPLADIGLAQTVIQLPSK